MRESLWLAAAFCVDYFSENFQTLSLSSFSVSISDYIRCRSSRYLNCLLPRNWHRKSGWSHNVRFFREMKHSLRNFLNVLHGPLILCKFVDSKKKRWVIVLLSWKKNPIVDLNENRQNLFYFYQLIIKIITYSTIRRRIILCDNSTQTVTSSTLKGKWQEPARSESCICAKEERCVQDQNDFASRSNAILLNLSLSV